MPSQQNPRRRNRMEQPAPQAARSLDRAARARKAKKLKTVTAAAGLAGTALFTGLTVNASQASAAHRIVSPDQQISQLEQANGGAFFSVDGPGAPSLGNGSAQTASGGS